ncbi:MAG: electron transport complex subunit RsxC [Candidatus Theseobacter exili]|nr:electron transport complex subunit RsxC [Candidatus Theseobacter exili]
MKIITFKRGGVHPPEKKELSKDRSAKKVKIPERVVIPMQQHIGAPAVPVVNVGDAVKKGQIIAKAGGFISVPVHASISGKITSIDDFSHPVFSKGKAIEIESDGLDSSMQMKVSVQPEKLTPREIVNIISDAGIVGMGGAMFPTHVKLSPPSDKKIDALIINGAECEPYITADYRSMLEQTQELMRGAKLMMKAVNAKKCYIAVEENKLDVYDKFSEELPRFSKDMIPVLLKVRYPQGAEKQLIKAVLNLEVPSGGLPMDIGVVVQNAATAVAVCEAIYSGKPLVERIVTVTGEGVVHPTNIRARIGTCFLDLIEHAGGLNESAAKVIMGGPMMGIAQYSLDVPVIKGTSSILVLNQDQINDYSYLACIKCGRCVEACPMGLFASVMGNAAEKEMYELAEEYNVADCIECGSCAYVCPSKRPLVQFFKQAKASITRRKKNG